MNFALLPETVTLISDQHMERDPKDKKKMRPIKDAPVWTFRPLGLEATTDLTVVMAENTRAAYAQAFRSQFVSVTNVQVDGVPFEIEKHFDRALPFSIAWELGQKLVDRTYLKDLDKGK
jgi:hypothetical protein